MNLAAIEPDLLSAFQESFNFPTDSFVIPHNVRRVQLMLFESPTTSSITTSFFSTPGCVAKEQEGPGNNGCTDTSTLRSF